MWPLSFSFPVRSVSPLGVGLWRGQELGALAWCSRARAAFLFLEPLPRPHALLFLSTPPKGISVLVGVGNLPSPQILLFPVGLGFGKQK